MKISLEPALQEPELGFTNFTIKRTIYRNSYGRFISSEQIIPAEGIIQPGAPEMLKLFPEENRKDDYITIYTEEKLITGENPGGDSWSAADKIRWDQRNWRVVKVRKWDDFGYIQAVAVLINE